MTAWLIIPQMIARIRNTVLVSSLLVLMTLGVVSISKACSNQAQQYFDEAYKYSIEGEYQKAIANYDEVIRLDFQLPKTYRNRGLAYFYLDQHDRAINDFDEAIRLDPQYALAYANRGRAYEKLDQKDKRDVDKKRACELDSKFCD